MENKKTNGPIDVNGDTTPITHKPIDQIDATQWNTMDLGDLWNQRIFLQNRLNLVLNNSGSPDAITAMQSGLANIDAIIQHKSINHAENNTNPASANTTIGLI